jgi:hypothetical protein
MRTIVERLEDIEGKMATISTVNMKYDAVEIRKDIMKLEYQLSQLCRLVGVRETEL